MSHHATRGRSRLPGPINVPEPYPPRWKFDIDRPKKTSDIPDDDFIGGVLDSKWTVVAGSPGVCDLTYGGGSRYDITSRDSWLLMQVDNGNNVYLRQTYTLPDGKSIVAKLSPSAMADAQSGIANNEIQTILSLSDGTSNPTDGNDTGLMWDTGTNGWRVLSFGSFGTAASTPDGSNVCSAPIASAIYFRILRSGLTYYHYWSTDGTVWMPLRIGTASSALTYLWIGCQSSASFGDPTPIQAVDWVRLGGSGVDPW